MSGNFTVMTNEDEQRLRTLENFYLEIRRIANCADLAKIVPVYEALSKVDPHWNRGGGIWNDIEGRN